MSSSNQLCLSLGTCGFVNGLCRNRSQEDKGACCSLPRQHLFFENEPDSLRALKSRALELVTLFSLPLSNSFVYPFLSEMFSLGKRDSLSCPAPHTKSQARIRERDFPLPSWKKGEDVIFRGIVIEF